jgi:hypothetical protein
MTGHASGVSMPQRAVDRFPDGDGVIPEVCCACGGACFIDTLCQTACMVAV